MDDELSRFEHVLLGAHLAVCRDCRRFADDVRWQTETIRAAPLEPLSRRMTLPARRSWRRPALGVSTVAAVAASVAALAVGLHAPSQTQSDSVPRAREVPAGVVRATQTELARDPAFMSRTQNGSLRGDPHTP
jgi:negative regulator of sigma E activity